MYMIEAVAVATPLKMVNEKKIVGVRNSLFIQGLERTIELFE